MVATKLHCDWKNDENATRKELQQDVTQEGRRRSWSRDSVNKRLVEIDDGERRFTWREYHGNFAVCRDDRGRTMWKYDNDNKNVDRMSDSGAESSNRPVAQEL